MAYTGGSSPPVADMTKEEENYWRGYIDAKVEGLGRSRTHYVSDEDKIKYRDELMNKYKLTQN